MSLVKNFINVGGATLSSRLLGFVRDILMAQVLGTGMVADAFFAAFRFPNLFRRLFAEGAFNAAFIPLFAKELEQNGEPSARRFAAEIISLLVVALIILTVLAEIFMPYVIAPFVPGFVDQPEKFQLTVTLTRITFPYLALMSMMAAFAGILNGLRKFFVAALAPTLLNVALISALALLVWQDQLANHTSAITLGIAVIIGGIAQIALIIWALVRADFLPRFVRPKWNSSTARFWALALPAILAGGITQINIFIGTVIASQGDSAISYLYYADRLYQLPLGIVGIAIGVVLLPELSRHIKGGRVQEAELVQQQSLKFALILSVPAAVAFAVIAEPIIRVMFERGAFDAAATAATAHALVAFAFGLPAFILIKLFQPAFFAREDTKTPTWFALLSVITNIALSLLLFPKYAHVGIAIATSVSAWVNLIALVVTLQLRGHWALGRAQVMLVIKIIACATLMGGLVFWLAGYFAPWLGSSASLVKQVIALGGLVGIGGTAFFLAAHLSGVQRLDQMKALVKR